MSSPTRFTSGITQNYNFQPLGKIGIPDPFFYATYQDDFLPYNSANYTVTAATGTAAATAGVGGRILMSTTAVISDFVSLQQAVAGFQITSGKKLAYLIRLQADSATLSTITAGLIQKTATPGTVVDGIYFKKASGATAIVLNVVSASTVIGTFTLPNVLATATDIDLGFMVDGKGNILVFAGAALVGNKPNQDNAVLGPVAKILSSSLTAAMTATLLTPTIAVSASTAVIRTMTVDFQLAAQER